MVGWREREEDTLVRENPQNSQPRGVVVGRQVVKSIKIIVCVAMLALIQTTGGFVICGVTDVAVTSCEMI